MQTPFVDIVLATNRVSTYIGDTVRSVTAQTYPHWRLIVVDDGSPDEAAVRRVVSAQPNAVVIRQGARGLPAARNRGIATGSSPLIAFLDDDDVWAPGKLEEQVAALAAWPDAVAAFTGGVFIDAQGREFGAGWAAPTLPSSQYVSGESPLPRIVTLMVRRSAHDVAGRFNESYTLAEDNEYILRLAICGEMVGVDRPLVHYRRHGGNMSAANSLQGRRAGRRLLGERLAEHRGNANVSALLRANSARFETSAADQCVSCLVGAVRRRDVRALREEIMWAGRRPLKTMQALRRVLARSRL